MSVATALRGNSTRLYLYRMLGDLAKSLTRERTTWRGGSIFDAALGVPRRRHPWEHPEDSATALLRTAGQLEAHAATLIRMAAVARDRADALINESMNR